MPRYFFNIHDGQDLPDMEGTDYPDPKTARGQGVIATGEMLKDLDGAFWKGAEWRMVVTDEQGATVCTLNLTGTVGDA